MKKYIVNLYYSTLVSASIEASNADEAYEKAEADIEAQLDREVAVLDVASTEADNESMVTFMLENLARRSDADEVIEVN